MAEGSAFEKKHISDNEKNDLGGVLEQLNLPPAVVTFVRENKRFVQIGTVLVVVAVVSWSFYGSYRDQKREKGASALSLAMEAEGTARLEALQQVETEFAGTNSALWAKLNAAHELANADQFEEAGQGYREVRAELAASSPLQPLVTAGIAQTSERLGQYQEAATAYESLKGVPGYEALGYLGLARLQEIQGEPAEALQIYEQYLATLEDGPRGQKTLVEEKIARIQAAL